MGESSGTAPGRPLGFDPDAVVEELMFLFWEKGFDATTQSDMAERTGLSTSSLFNTFGDKYSIFDRALACYNSLTAEHLSPLLTGEDGVSELESLIDRRASLVTAPFRVAGCFMTNTMCELGERDQRVRVRCDEFRSIHLTALSAAIDRGVASGTLTPGDTGTRAALLLAANIGSAATERSSNGTTEATTMIEGMRDLIESWRTEN